MKFRGEHNTSSGSVLARTAIFKRLTSETLIYGLGSVFTRLIGFFLLPFYTRLIPPAEYAVIDVLLTFNTILVIIAVLGIDSGIALVFQNENEQLQRRMVTSSFVFQSLWSVLFVSALILFAQPLSAFLLNDSNLAKLTILSFLLLPFQSLIRFAQNLHKWKQEPIRFVLISSGSAVSVMVANVWFVYYLELGVLGILYGMLLANVIFAIVGTWLIIRHFRPEIAFADMRGVLALGAPFALAGALQMLLPNINRTLLVDLAGMEATGVYAAGLKLSMAVLLVSSAFNLAYSPYALSIHKSDKAKPTYELVARIYALISMLWIAVLFMFAQPLVKLILGGNDYVEAFRVMGPLLLALWFSGLRATFVMGLIIVRKTKRFGLTYALAAGISWPLNVMLISGWGTLGAAWATVGVEFLLTGLLFVVTQRVYYVPYQLKPVFWLIAGYLGLMLLVGLLPSWPLAVDLSVRLVGCILFMMVCLLWSGAIKRDELKGAMLLSGSTLSSIVRK